MVRRALVAGLFYAREPSSLRRQLENCFRHSLGPGDLPQLREHGERRILGVVVPHAGYMYSGMTAAHAYAALAQDGIPQVVILLAPAHFRPGAPFAVWTKGHWETPLGSVRVDEELATTLAQAGHGFAEDTAPHLGNFGHGEHSIEVQLPFLQFVFGDRTPPIVPIAVSSQNFAQLQQAGQVLHDAIVKTQRDAVIVASCDFTHYEPHAIAEVHDRETLNHILALDSYGAWQAIRRYPSQSDVLVAIPVIEACKGLGATEGKLLGYSTSGQVTGDMMEVVGYAAAILVRGNAKQEG